MINIDALLQKVGLLKYKDEQFQEFKIITANQISDGKNVSKYIFLDIGDIDLVKFIDDEYSYVETNFLKSTFYKLEGDLAWNLYLVIVVPEQLYNHISPEKIIEFEKNNRYARKVIIRDSEFEKLIPIGTSIYKPSKAISIDPLNDWMKVLQAENLEFSFDEYNSKNVDKYLLKQNISKNMKKVNKTKHIEKIDVISKINLTNKFRPHCYGENKSIVVGGVNLLYGSNGCGKTSLLEAIEVAMTGDLDKSNSKKDVDIKDDIDSGISLTMSSGEILNIPKKPVQKKDRENGLYQVVATKEGKGSLNQTFHHYNYFSFEDVYKFTYLNEQLDFNTEFSKSIFGEVITQAEKNILRYEQAFKLRNSELKNERKILENELNDLNRIIDRDVKDNSNLELLNKTLNIVLKDFKDITLDENIGEIRQRTNNIAGYRIKLDALKNSFENLDTGETLNEMYHNNKKNIYDTQIEIEKIINNIHNSKGIIFSKKNKLYDIEKSLSKFKYELEKLIKLRDIKVNSLNQVSNIEFANKILTLYYDIIRKDNDLKNRIPFQVKYKELSNLRYSGLSNLERLKEKLEVIDNEIINTETIVFKIEQDIEEQENLNSEINVLLTQIETVGNIYVEKSKTDTCPLCNHKYDTPEELLRMMGKVTVLSSGTLNKLYDEININKHKLSLKQTERMELMSQIAIVNNINSAYNSINQQIPPHKDLDISSKYKQITNKLHNINQDQTNLYELKSQLREMSKDIYSVESIKEILGFMNEYLAGQNEFICASKVDSINKNINEKIANLNKDYKKKLDEKEELEKQSEELNIIIQELIKEYNEKKPYCEGLLAINKKIDDLLKELNELSVNLRIDNKSSWSFKLNQLVVAQRICEQEIERMLKFSESNRNNLKVVELENILRVVLDKEKECRKTLKQYNKINRVSEYSREFVENNISKISELFTSLHFPRDFDGLKLNEDAQIIGYRKQANGDAEVSVNKMSTGQRTAVVLSVFFVLFNSLDTVPQFILLDEPVSNIDDLNMLALFDFLRELHIQKECQIFER